MEHTGAVYESIAERYADTREAKPINVYFERPAFVSLLPPLDGLKVLDAGCGPGWYAAYCKRSGASVTAFDLNPNFVKLTRERLNEVGPMPPSDVFEADLSSPLLLIEDASFDLVICSLVLHYLKDWRPALAELYRVLNDDGRLVFSTHHPANDWLQCKTESYFDVDLVEDEWDIGPVQFYRRPLTKICDDLRCAGFLIEQLVEPQPLPEWQAVDPETYERFSTTPWRVMVRACKPGAHINP